MSVFNYKAEFLKQDKHYVFYRFYPEFIDFKNKYGEFQINLETMESEIISKTEIDGKNSLHCNDRPVSALTYKVRKFFEEHKEFPKEIYHIA